TGSACINQIETRQEEERYRGQGGSDQRGKRRIAAELSCCQPEDGEGQNARPGNTQKNAKVGGNAFAALEAKPDGEKMADEGGKACHQRVFHAPFSGDEHRYCALGSIEEQRCGG